MALECGGFPYATTRHAISFPVDDPAAGTNDYAGDTFTVEQSTVGAAGPWTDSLIPSDFLTDCDGATGPFVTGGATAGLATVTDVTGLQPATHYWFRITQTACVHGGTHPTPTSIICEYDTDALLAAPCPTVSDITETGATVTDEAGFGGFFHAESIAPDCDLDTLELDYGTVSGGPYPDTDTQATADQVEGVPHVLTGLTPGTTYFYRTRVQNPIDGADFYTTEECSFTTATAAAEPAAACAAASAITQTSATLNGTADAAPTDGTVQIRYGSTAGGPYGTTTGSAAGADSAGQAVSGPAAGLAANTTYYYIVEVLDSGAAVLATSAECSFTTAEETVDPEPPAEGPIFTPAPCDDGGSGEPIEAADPVPGNDDECLTDDNGVFFRRTTTAINGDVTISFVDIAGAAYVPVGEVGPCSLEQAVGLRIDVETQILCRSRTDNTGGPGNERIVRSSFIRSYHYDQATGDLINTVDTTMDGDPIDLTGWTVGNCDFSAGNKYLHQLCDSGNNNTPFIREYVVDEIGFINDVFFDHDLEGEDYTPVGPAVLCNPSFDPVGWESICYRTVADGPILAGTKRHDDAFPPPGFLVFDSQGNLVNTGAPGYEQVPCASTECCPVVLGSGCASGGRQWTSLRAEDGTITLYDQATGDEVDPGDVEPCPAENEPTPVELVTQARLVGSGDPAWTPANDVTGTITSLSVTVITGSTSLVDSDGTNLDNLPPGLTFEWNAEDANSIVPPQSIAALQGQFIATWTERV